MLHSYVCGEPDGAARTRSRGFDLTRASPRLRD